MADLDSRYPFPIGDLVVQWPRRGRVFDAFGIDFASGGGQSLEEACARAGADLERVLHALDACSGEVAGDPPALPPRDPAGLAAHILQVHHAYLWRVFPVLQDRLDRLEDSEEFEGIRSAWAGFRSAMEEHLAKEENAYFPLLCRLARAGGPGNPELARTIAMIEGEHGVQEDLLVSLMRQVGGQASAITLQPEFLGIKLALEELELDMKQHIHKETNVLFPAAAAWGGNSMVEGEV